jgi:DNA modification methylase
MRARTFEKRSVSVGRIAHGDPQGVALMSDYKAKNRGADPLALVELRLDEVVRPNRWARSHSPAQISKLMASFAEFGVVNPIIVDASKMLVAGEARLQAAEQLGLKTIPAICAGHLTAAQAQAYRIADNKLAEGASWDLDVLREEVASILSLDIDPQALGFETPDLDVLLVPGVESPPGTDPVDPPEQPIVRLGDMFSAGSHAILCGDALDPDDLKQLMDGERAHMSSNDVPFNVPIRGHVSTRRGGAAPREFAQASGEMSTAEFSRFLETALKQIQEVSHPGAIVEVFMDWRNIHTLINAGQGCGLEYINLAVWNKHSAGLGSFLRSQHELIAIFRTPGGSHKNHVQLGAKGRYRTNVWSYAGKAGFSRNRKEELDRHPTPKPMALIADSILDCTDRADLVLDLFGGGGTTLIACERTGRRARLMEIDPGYVEATLLRYRAASGKDPVHTASGLTLTELAEQRRTEWVAAPEDAPPRKRRPPKRSASAA